MARKRDYKAGDKFSLPMGWTLILEKRDNPPPSLQAFIYKGDQSASLAYALEYDADSEMEEDIPAKVLAATELFAEYI